MLGIALNAWTKKTRSKMKAAPERAEALLMKVENDLQEFGAMGIKPNGICYSCVINCWAKSGRKEAPDAALKVFNTMKQQYLAGDNSLRPNKIVYETVISAFVQAGQASRAKELRDEMSTWK